MDRSRDHNLSAEVVARYLGLKDAPTGPHELLGLSLQREDLTAQKVSRALLSRLRRIDEHPQGRTPEADELRVALYVAAAQLRDPRVREALLSTDDSERVPFGEDAQPNTPDPLEAPGAVEAGRGEQPAALEPPTASSVDQSFRLAAEHVLASCGGWNAESKRLLGYLARSASVDAQGLQQALVDITRSHESPRYSRDSEHEPIGDYPGSIPSEGAYLLSRSNYANRPLDRRPEDTRTRTWMTIGTALMLASSAVMAVVLLGIVLQRTMTESGEVRTNEVLLPPIAPPRLADTDGLPEDEQENPAAVPIGLGYDTGFDDAVRLLQTLDRDSFERAPEESLKAFEESLDFFSRGWFRAESGVLDVASLAFRDAVLAAHEHDNALGMRMVRLLANRLDPFDAGPRMLDASSLHSSAFCYGICGMLLEAPIVPNEERRLRTRLNSIASASGASFKSGSFFSMVEMALRVQAIGLVPRPSDQSDARLVGAWKAWLDMSQALPQPLAVEIKLDALENVITSGEDPVFHSPTKAVMDEIVNAIDWLDDVGRIASQRLLAWFDDSVAVDVRDLSVVTEELVDGALLPSLDPTYKLSGSASADDRLQLRDRYALQFSLPQSGGGKEFAADWSGFAIELIETGFTTDEGSALNAAIRASWLNEAAELWFASDSDGAQQCLQKAAGSLDALVASRGGPVPFGTGRTARADGEWAARYILARRSATERTNLLYELSNTGGPAGQADADVLAEAASYSTPVEIRSIAQRAIVDYSNRPEVILGLLEVLPRAAKQEGVSQMIRDATGRDLPPVDRQEWLQEARKALVARSMELLVAADNRHLDVASEALASTYAVRLGLLPNRPSQGGSGPVPPVLFDDSVPAAGTSNDPSRLVGEYADRLEAEAARYPDRTTSFATLNEIASRRQWRLRLVSPGIESFTADQTSVLELHAYILSNSRPVHSEDTSRIVRDAAADRRVAQTVYEQIAINEMAMLKLNLLRLTGGEKQ